MFDHQKIPKPDGEDAICERDAPDPEHRRGDQRGQGRGRERGGGHGLFGGMCCLIDVVGARLCGAAAGGLGAHTPCDGLEALGNLARDVLMLSNALRWRLESVVGRQGNRFRRLSFFLVLELRVPRASSLFLWRGTKLVPACHLVRTHKTMPVECRNSGPITIKPTTTLKP